MPQIEPGLHVDIPKLAKSLSIVVYDHPAEEVAQHLGEMSHYIGRQDPFEEVLVEFAPETPDAPPQSALLGRFCESYDALEYAGTMRCVLYTFQEGSDWSLLYVLREGKIAHEWRWGHDLSAQFAQAGLAPPPAQADETVVTIGGEQLRYQGSRDPEVQALATKLASSRELVDCMCRRLGVGVPDPSFFPSVNYQPTADEDRSAHLPPTIVHCLVR